MKTKIAFFILALALFSWAAFEAGLRSQINGKYSCEIVLKDTIK